MKRSVAAMLATLCLWSCAASPPRRVVAANAGGALRFIEDDYPRALAEARARKIPLFVDAWAPWCHTCRFMRAYVLPDAALAPDAARYVWLSIDTEADRNAAFVARYPMQVWPTLMVIDPSTETAVLRWPGSANVIELKALFADGEAAFGSPGSVPAGSAGAAALSRADRLAGDGRAEHLDEAAAGYRAAIAASDASARPRIVESLVLTLLSGHGYEACAAAALQYAAALPRGTAFANAAATGLVCAELAKRDAPWRAAAIARLEPLCVEALALPGLLADDRAGVYEAVVEAREEAGDGPGATAIALRWLSFLEDEQAHAPNAEARASLDPMVVEAATKAGVAARAIAPLERSERALPDDYNAAARLALVYRALGRHTEALAASDRAIAIAYGPRRIRLHENRASIFESMGDPAGAARSLTEALRIAEALAPGPIRDANLARLRARLQTK